MEHLNNSAEQFLQHLERIFKVEPEIFQEQSTIPDLPGVTVFIFRDRPDQGMITGITYGLSFVEHPLWKNGRPELMICVDSTDDSWPLAMSVMTENLRGNCPFTYGNTIDFKEKISESSDMDAFMVFAPSILAPNEYLNIEVGLDYKISIAGLYPIYAGEIDLLNNHGLEWFWKRDGFDVFSVTRDKISE
jgi:hypothetical protein